MSQITARIAQLAREKAKKQGKPHYKTGVACIHGHIADRYTSNGRCVVCVLKYTTEAHQRRAAQRLERRLATAAALAPPVKATPAPTKPLTARQIAVAAGESKYNGKPCINCNSETRYVRNKKCVHCSNYRSTLSRASEPTQSTRKEAPQPYTITIPAAKTNARKIATAKRAACKSCTTRTACRWCPAIVKITLSHIRREANH